MNGQGPPFFGKFRGKVTDNRDPQMLGRVRVKAPDVYGDNESGWAMPALPYTGKGVGLFLIPPTDASVWVEFEHGDPDYPIWAGGFWAQGEVPASAIEAKVLKTDAGTITLDDQESITIDVSGLKIVIDANKIKLSNSSQTIEITSSSVKINGDALEVT